MLTVNPIPSPQNPRAGQGVFPQTSPHSKGVSQAIAMEEARTTRSFKDRLQDPRPQDASQVNLILSDTTRLKQVIEREFSNSPHAFRQFVESQYLALGQSKIPELQARTQKNDQGLIRAGKISSLPVWGIGLGGAALLFVFVPFPFNLIAGIGALGSTVAMQKLLTTEQKAKVLQGFEKLLSPLGRFNPLAPASRGFQNLLTNHEVLPQRVEESKKLESILGSRLAEIMALDRSAETTQPKALTRSISL